MGAQFEVAEWQFIPAFRGKTLRAVVEVEGTPFKHTDPDEITERLLIPMMDKLGIKSTKKGVKTLVVRQTMIGHLTVQFSGEMCACIWHVGFVRDIWVAYCVCAFSVKQDDLKLVTLHVVDKTQLEGTYTGRVARALDVLMLCAGYGGQMVYNQFVWQQCYVQGRTLLTPKEMQNRWPSQWQLIVEGLMPGMLDLANKVELRGEHELDVHEKDMRNQVSVSLYLLTAFLHGSSVHLYNHDTSPVFMALPLFREEWFRQWHREQFSPVVAELQMKAEAVSRHLTSINNRGHNVLAKAREDLGLPHNFL